MNSIILITTTIGDLEDAKRLARQLVERKLAACVQIDGPLQSVYAWQGQICQEPEFRISCKTIATCQNALVGFLQTNHPYDLPEIVIDTVQASSAYSQWVASMLVRQGDA